MGSWMWEENRRGTGISGCSGHQAGQTGGHACAPFDERATSQAPDEEGVRTPVYWNGFPNLAGSGEGRESRK